MDRRFTGFVIGFVVTIVLIAIAAFWFGLDVTVHSHNWVYNSSGNGRWMLNVHETGELTNYTVVDTETGYSYVFDQSNARHVIPPADQSEEQAESSPEQRASDERP